MYKLFAFYFFTAATIFILYGLTGKISSFYFIKFLLLSAAVYFYFIAYVLVKSITELREILSKNKKTDSPVSKIGRLKIPKFLSPALAIVYLVTIFTIILYSSVYFFSPEAGKARRERIAISTPTSIPQKPSPTPAPDPVVVNALLLEDFLKDHKSQYQYKDSEYAFMFSLDKDNINYYMRQFPYNLSICNNSNMNNCFSVDGAFFAIYQSDKIGKIKVEHKPFTKFNYLPLFAIQMDIDNITKTAFLYPQNINEKYPKYGRIDFPETTYFSSGVVSYSINTDYSEFDFVYDDDSEFKIRFIVDDSGDVSYVY